VEEGLGGLWEDDSFMTGTGVVWDSRRKERTVEGCDWQGGRWRGVAEMVEDGHLYCMITAFDNE